MIRVTWTGPTRHTSGSPIKPGELAGFTLKMKVDGAPTFTEIATLPAAATEFEIDVNDAGTYQFELVAEATNGKDSAPATGSVTITDETPLEAPALSVALA